MSLSKVNRIFRRSKSKTDSPVRHNVPKIQLQRGTSVEQANPPKECGDDLKLSVPPHHAHRSRSFDESKLPRTSGGAGEVDSEVFLQVPKSIPQRSRSFDSAYDEKGDLAAGAPKSPWFMRRRRSSPVELTCHHCLLMSEFENKTEATDSPLPSINIDMYLSSSETDYSDYYSSSDVDDYGTDDYDDDDDDAEEEPDNEENMMFRFDNRSISQYVNMTNGEHGQKHSTAQARAHMYQKSTSTSCDEDLVIASRSRCRKRTSVKEIQPVKKQEAIESSTAKKEAFASKAQPSDNLLNTAVLSMSSNPNSEPGSPNGAGNTLAVPIIKHRSTSLDTGLITITVSDEDDQSQTLLNVPKSQRSSSVDVSFPTAENTRYTATTSSHGHQ